MLSNGRVRDMIRQGIIKMNPDIPETEVGRWGILLHLDMIGPYPQVTQNPVLGRTEEYWPVQFQDRDRNPLTYEMPPNTTHCVTCLEQVSLPSALYAEIRATPELASAGGLIVAGPIISNGKRQNIEFLLTNIGPGPLLIKNHLPLAELIFEPVQGTVISPVPQRAIPEPEPNHEAPPWIRKAQARTRGEKLPEPPTEEDFPF